jgi:16S rRNA G966 N2-methylase RsmD
MTSFAGLYPAIGEAPDSLRPGGVRYREPLDRGTRGAKNTAAYNAHSYPTKVPPEAIEPFIEHHTRQGAWVLDPFCGSGMTGLAANRVGRRAILNDLSYGATHLAWNMTMPCDPAALTTAADAILAACCEDLDRLYRVAGRDGEAAHLHWTLYSQWVACPECGRHSSIWEEGADPEAGTVAAEWPCPECGTAIVRRRATALGATPALVSLSDDSGRCERPVEIEDLVVLDEAAAEPVPGWYPQVPLGPDREMYIRSALYLQGVEEVADFWTPRNLRALARLWREIRAWPDERVRQALALAFTNTAWHGTRMRRYNARGGQRPLTGTLFIPQLSIEVNVADVFANKIRQLRKFFAELGPRTPASTVLRGPATSLPLPDASVDYCFTDPPFGSNIFYGDCAVVWESWLGETTPTAEEAVVNHSLKPAAGGRTIDEYAATMRDAFAEVQRVLKRNAWATVVFQSSDAEVWAALRAAVEEAGFDLASASYLDKTQQSHKGYKGRSGAEDVASFDIVLNLHKPGRKRAAARPSGGFGDASQLIERHLRSLGPVGVSEEDDRQRTLPFLHSLLVRAHFNGGIGLEIGEYAVVRRICEKSFTCDEQGRWAVPVAAADVRK